MTIPPDRSRDRRIEDPTNLWIIHPAGRLLLPWFVARAISANAVSVVGLFLGVLAALAYANWHSWPFALAGLLLSIGWLIADGLDGMIARATGTASPLGRALDGLCDHGVFILIYVVLALSIGTVEGWVLACAAGAAHALQSNFYEGERALQSKIAGLIWSQSYSLGDAFYKARNALPTSVRRASFERYVADPYDGAAPHSVAQAIARLKRGELLSAASTQRLLSTMSQTKTGAMRVRAALKPGWKWSHKTGTGQNFQGRVGGINDIGILTAPDGTAYAMAIMTVPNKTDGTSQDLMQAVARTVISEHEARRL